MSINNPDIQGVCLVVKLSSEINKQISQWETVANSMKEKLVGGFNPSEKYKSNWKSSLNRGENKKYLKPPTRKIWSSK